MLPYAGHMLSYGVSITTWRWEEEKIEKVKKVLWLLKCLHNFDVTIQ